MCVCKLVDIHRHSVWCQFCIVMLRWLVRFEVLLVMTVQIAVCWHVMLYDLMLAYDTSGEPAASVVINIK